MIRQNQTTDANEVDMDEKLIQTLEAMVVEDGNGHEFSFAEDAVNQEQQTTEFDWVAWNNAVNAQLYALEQNNLSVNEQMKNQNKLIEKLISKLTEQEKTVTENKTVIDNKFSKMENQMLQLSEGLNKLIGIISLSKKQTEKPSEEGFLKSLFGEEVSESLIDKLEAKLNMEKNGDGKSLLVVPQVKDLLKNMKVGDVVTQKNAGITLKHYRLR